jgi:hypothetical protein
MKIVAWNCSKSFKQKYAKLTSFHPDIAVIPECESLEKMGDLYQRLFPRALWFGDNPDKGLGVFAGEEYELSVHPAYNNNFKWVVPIKVRGPENFTLIAVWTKKHKVKKQSYIGQLYGALQHYELTLIKNENCLIIGDFNSNVRWDNRGWINHSQVVEMLSKYGIVSAYHVFFGEQQGQESRPTYYYHYDRNKPYHIDYAFIPFDQMSKLQNFDVGTYDDWRNAPSDHVPLFLKFS